MNLLDRRRGLMVTPAQSGLDTSPVIILYGYALGRGNPASAPPVVNQNACISDVYYYTASSSRRTIVHYGMNGNIQLFRDGQYVDYWGLNSYNPQEEKENNYLNANSNSIQFSIAISMLSSCYVYIKETGEILFAGRDSIYYGHTNVSEI